MKRERLWCWVALIGVIVGTDLSWAELPSFTPDWEARRQEERSVIKMWKVQQQERKNTYQEELKATQKGQSPVWKIVADDGLVGGGYFKLMWGIEKIGLLHENDREKSLANLKWDIHLWQTTYVDPDVRTKERILSMQSALTFLEEKTETEYREILGKAGSAGWIAQTMELVIPLTMVSLAQPPGLLIQQLRRGSSVERAGVKKGDILLGVEGRPVRAVTDFFSTINAFEPGSSLKWTVSRGSPFVVLTYAVSLDEITRAIPTPYYFENQKKWYQKRLEKIDRDLLAIERNEILSEEPLEEYRRSHVPKFVTNLLLHKMSLQVHRKTRVEDRLRWNMGSVDGMFYTAWDGESNGLPNPVYRFGLKGLTCSEALEELERAYRNCLEHVKAAQAYRAGRISKRQFIKASGRPVYAEYPEDEFDDAWVDDILNEEQYLEPLQEAYDYLKSHPEEWERARTMSRESPLTEAQRMWEEQGEQDPTFEKIAWLGLTFQSDLRSPVQVTGCVVKAVTPNGPAAQAGIRIGDALLSIEGQPIQAAKDLSLIVSKYAVGSTVRCVLQRGPATLTLRATLQPEP